MQQHYPAFLAHLPRRGSVLPGFVQREFEEYLKCGCLEHGFPIDIATCQACGGAVRVVACIEDPVAIKQIFDHLEGKAKSPATAVLAEPRAPPTSH